jgi:hypothetical protein
MPLQGHDAFGETPKAAGEDARTPQSICVVTAENRHTTQDQNTRWNLVWRNLYASIGPRVTPSR